MIPGDKAYFPGSDVLVNKFDIRDAETARAVEYKFASVRELELAVSPIDGAFDFAHLQSIHHHMFQDMYDWAGQVRKLDFAKRNKETGMINRFTPIAAMEEKAEAFNKFIADNNQLRGLPKPEFVKAITEAHTMLNEMHPFREGNGRSTRIFLSQLAKEAGFELNMEALDKERWNLASHKAIPQYDPKDPNNVQYPSNMEMRQIFHEALQPTREHAIKHETRGNALKLYPDLQGAFERTDAIAGYASKLSDQNVATRLVEAERGRIETKLKTETTVRQQEQAMEKLRTEQSNVNPSRPGQIDQYELVAHTMENVLKAKGYTSAVIEKTMEQTNKNLARMRDAGIPAPPIKIFSKDAQRETKRATNNRSEQAGKDVDISPS